MSKQEEESATAGDFPFAFPVESLAPSMHDSFDGDIGDDLVEIDEDALDEDADALLERGGEKQQVHEYESTSSDAKPKQNEKGEGYVAIRVVIAHSSQEEANSCERI